MSAEAKHTPGPWTIDLTGPFTLGGDLREVVALDGEGMVTRGICSCMFDTDTFPDGKAFLEDKANAALIAAAPALLEACKAAYAALETLRQTGDEQDWEAFEPLHRAHRLTEAAVAQIEEVA